MQVLDSDSCIFTTMADYSLHYMESTENPLRMLWLPWPLYHITLCGLHCLDCREGEKQGGGCQAYCTHCEEGCAIWLNGDSQHHHQPPIVSQKHPSSFYASLYCTIVKRSQNRCDRSWWAGWMAAHCVFWCRSYLFPPFCSSSTLIQTHSIRASIDDQTLIMQKYREMGDQHHFYCFRYE